ncbi:MAG: endonuclease/exonuclease/phosphatase family protein [Vicinamibacteria bacterium]|nr:endonuclease/exonuclease/phosphatase family protein [Vicinamibacteria bacterium]
MKVRVLTYNIHRAIGVDRRFRPERIVRIISNYHADIVLLQEVDEGVPRSRELDLARELATELGFPYRAVGHNVTLRKGRYGNATLSRYPILSERNIDLTINLWKRRGCQHTAIALKDPEDDSREPLQLDVFNLHLGLSARQRARQVEILARSGEMTALPADAPCLVGGDFNDWRSLLVPFLTQGMSFRSATDPRSGRAQPLLTYPSFFPRGPLDRLYYRGPIRLLSAHRCRLRLSQIASDHLPIIADFEIS